MSSIFISYRQKDTGGHAGRLYDRLTQWFDREHIFIDKSAIESGADFPTEIQDGLDSARVFLIIIGPDWLSVENKQRLHDERDFVRREIVHALRRREEEKNDPPLVLPVLVGGASVPEKSVLPEIIHPITDIQFHQFTGNYDDYDRQVKALLDIVGRHCRGDWVSSHNRWLQEGLANREFSFSRFRQDISVLGPDSHYVPRKEALRMMDSWWNEWAEHHRPFALLGEEGDGKSWALAAWLAKKITDPEFSIPIVYVPATLISNTDKSNIEQAMADALARGSSAVSQPEWVERLRFMMQCPDDDNPKCLFVVDGINERSSLDWRLFIDTCLDKPFLQRAAFMVSCRSAYWQRHLAGEFKERIISIILPPFNEEELDEALAQYHCGRNDFSDKVLELVAKPRYLDMAVRLRDRLNESEGDITIDRLIYEDWRDMTSRKRGSITPLSHDDFLVFIKSLIGKYGDRVDPSGLAQELALYGNQSEIMSELLTAGILHNENGKLKVSEKPLVLGFGLILANELEESGRTDKDELEEIIAKHMEPKFDMDRKIQICAMALFLALSRRDYPDPGRMALFRYWLSGRNFSEEDMKRICTYLPMQPAIFFKISEELWSEGIDNHEAQDSFMVAFLRHGNQDRIREEMVRAFERWIGFINPSGYFDLHEKKKEKQDEYKHEVEKRLGRSAELGPLKLLGCRLELVADPKLLRLGQVAMSVMSYYDRMPFLHSLVICGVACAVMGGGHLAEFGWVMRTASRESQEALISEAQRLMAIGGSTALSAADRILFSVCSEAALNVRDCIPEEYKGKNLWRQFLEKKNPYNSIWLWDEETYLEYIQKTELSSEGIARNLGEVAINPDAALPEELAKRIDSAGQSIDFTQVRSHRGRSEEDSFLEDIEPALCAYRPSQYKELFCRLARTFSGRPASSRMPLAFELLEHLPIVGEIERAIIENEWRISLQDKGSDTDHAETILFSLVMFDRATDKQFQLLKERGYDTSFFADHGPFFSELSADVILLVENVLSQFDPTQLRMFYGFLHYLSMTLRKLNEEIRQALLRLFTIGDSVIRYRCIEIICRTNDLDAAQAVMESGWNATIDGQCDLERDWGSILLGRFGSTLCFEELAGRISPVWLGYAVNARGDKPEEVEKYAQLLHGLWCRIANPSVDLESLLRHVTIDAGTDEINPVDELSINLNRDRIVKLTNNGWGGSVGVVSDDDMKRAFDPKAADKEWKRVREQVLALFQKERTRGSGWIGVSFSHGGLDTIIEKVSPVWRQWIKPVLSNNLRGRQLLIQCQGLYERLCAALLNAEPETGIALFKVIMENKSMQITDSKTGIRHLLFDLFYAHDSPPILDFRKTFLYDSDSDQALFDVTLLAHLCGKTEWINAVAQELIAADNDLNNSRGLAILGFSNSAFHAEQLQWWIDSHQESWVMDVARTALRRHQYNSWARSWFQRLIDEDHRVNAWAAFRIFLRCVDQRFWIWGEEMIRGGKLPEWKTEAYLINKGTIKESIKKNGEKLKKTFVGHEVKENEIWPWMKRYTS